MTATGVEGTHTYQYDALGRRVRKTTGGTGASDTVFVRDGQTVIAEYAATSAAASPLRKYVNASYVDEPVLLVDRTAAGSTGAGTDEQFYYHRNQQYSITALCDNSGAVTERYAYTAYGEPTILDGPGTTTRTASFIDNPYLYTARAYDPETGLYYFRARMYEGRQGRFLSHDPIMYPDGANTYRAYFVISFVDPNGLVVTKEECKAAGDRMKANWAKAFEDTSGNTLACPVPEVTCNCCDQSQLDSGELGSATNGDHADRQLESGKTTVEVCINSPSMDANQLTQTLTHEFVHAWDFCKSKSDPKKTCDNCLCTEIRAYSLDGSCDSAPNKWECVKAGAEGSAIACPCNDVTGAALVVRIDKLKDRCFIPTKPTTFPPPPPWK